MTDPAPPPRTSRRRTAAVPNWRRVVRPAVVLPLLIATSAADHWRVSRQPHARRDLHGRRALVVSAGDGLVLAVRPCGGTDGIVNIKLEGTACIPDDALAEDADITPREAAALFLESTAVGRWVDVLLEDRPDLRDVDGCVRAYLRLAPDPLVNSTPSAAAGDDSKAQIEIGDLINERVIAAGWATADVARHCLLHTRFEQCERRARRARLGLWAVADDDRAAAAQSAADAPTTEPAP